MRTRRVILAVADPDTDPERGSDLGGLTAEVSPLLGRELTAYVAGAGSARELERWARDDDAPARRSAAERLRTALHVIEVFAAANRASRAAGWLCDPRAVRAGASPAQLIRDAVPDSARPILAAARRFALSVGR
ncbi:hypothetical protein [Rhizomonospora bruguierae]|uniref:hypothetical protein n=1 Tax=Rhizomonospora bruguierae TaxID=1581705 RepID=UPI001BCC23FE|nr:hypothetical protein [Micromonospora sp. NBRC 107566]